MTRPCLECPFLKDSIPGHLGGFSVEETLSCAKSESDFICHVTRETDNEYQCVGRLLYASKICKSFRNLILEPQRLYVKQINDLDLVLGFDFTKHHSND